MLNRTFLLSFCLLVALTPLLRGQETGARYLIITHDSYYSALQPLAQWKTQKGLKAKIVKLSEIGSDSTQIRNYIVNAYNTWNITPEYLLLVGNKYQVPFPLFMHPGAVISYSDNYYANVTGDFHNELYHGRFWVWDTLQAKTIVAKVLGYEKDPFMTDSLWFKKGTTIVNEYEYGQPSSESLYWADARYAHEFMIDAGFAHIDSFSYLRGNTSIDVINAINNGRSYILFRGLGVNYWEWPFDNITPSQMSNGFKLPVVLSGTCATIEGIGEDWTNAGTPEQPKGVVGFYGTTTALFAAAEMRSALCRGTTASIFGDSSSNLGKAAEAGRLQYYAEFGDLIDYHSWTCLGDPEMTIWTSTPMDLTVEHNPYFATGICTATVDVAHNSEPVRGALVCVMAKADSTYYHYDYTDSTGSITFTDTLHVPGDSVYFTVTGHNLRTYQAVVPVYFSNGPYVTLYTYDLSDSLGGNQDGIANPAEDIEIPVGLRNWGNTTAHGVFAIMEKMPSDTFCALYDTIKYIGNIAPLESVYVGPDGFNVVIDSNCPDLQNISLDLRVFAAGGFTWISDLDFTVHAPVISYQDYHFPENLKYILPGDTGELFIELTNNGSYPGANVQGVISCNDSLVTIIDSTATFGTIQPDSLGTNQADPFVISADPATLSCHLAELTLKVISGVYSVSHNFTVYIGQKDYLIWDPDPNHSSGPTIHSCLTELGFLGDYVESFPYQYLNIYKALFTCSGISPNKYIIYDTSIVVPELEGFLDTGGKMYLEGGDVWYVDPSVGGHDFGPYFCISPIYNSLGPLAEISGTAGTFTEGMYFSYTGENSSIDRIGPIGSGFLIFSNAYNGYGCGIAANNHTVGLSFELGGLVDSVAPSTKVALIDSIMDYFGILPTGITESELYEDIRAISLSCTPNPFRHTTSIKCTIDDPGYTIQDISLGIYDVTGRCVRCFYLESYIMNRGSELLWDGTDQSGRLVPQGVYFVRLETQHARITLKTVLLR